MWKKTRGKVVQIQKGVEHVISACQIGAVDAATAKQRVDSMLGRMFFRRCLQSSNMNSSLKK
jgi:hypothetical protein